MKKIHIGYWLIGSLIIVALAFAAGTATDYVTFTPAANPGAAAEGTIYYDSDTDMHFGMDDGAVWYPMGPEVRGFKPVATASETAEGYVYYDSDVDRLYVRTGAAAWEPLNEQTSDEVYEEGQGVTLDAGAIAWTNAEVDGQDTLAIAHSGAAGTGQAVEITDTKSGAHATMIIDHTSGNASSGVLHIRDNTSDAADLAYGILIESVDGTKEIVDALVIRATTNAMITDAIDVSDAEITNAINFGNNTVTGANTIIDLNFLDMDAAGDISFSETGGSNADADFQVDGFSMFFSGQMGDDASNYTAFSTDGVLTFAGNARPTHTDYFWTSDFDLVTVHGDGTAPTENEAGSTFNFSSWSYTEGNGDVSYMLYMIPEDMDVSAAMNIFLIWTTEDAGGDTCLWKVQYDFWALEAEAIDNTWIALDTIVADDTGAQFQTATTSGGQISGGTFSDNDACLMQISLTDCNDAAEADLMGWQIQYYKEKI